MQVVNKVEEYKELVIDKEFLRLLLIEDIEYSSSSVSHDYFYTENLKAQISKKEEELKLEYKIWLSDRKKELDRKLYPNEMAKEDGVITKYRNEYLQFNKKLIDLAYQKNLLQGISRAVEMKSNIIISLLNSKKNKKEQEETIEKWNTKVEKTKI